MQGLKKLLVIPVGALMLSGCVRQIYTDTEDVKDMKSLTATGGSAFTQALSKEYAAYAIFEAEEEYEWDHAAIFARKAKAAAKGQEVLPDEVSGWDIPADRAGPLRADHKRLMSLLDGGARDRVPQHAARAQAMFDCWLEEEAEGNPDQPYQGSSCMAIFKKTLPLLEGHTKIVKTFIVYFDFNKSDITSESANILNQVAAEQAKIMPSDILVKGHTDTAGSKAYNEALSLRRAQAVSAALAKRGVKARVIKKSFGEGMLAIQTADEVKEAGNRRVEIYFEK